MSAIPTSFLAVQAFVFGTLFGSFSNVVIHRVPIGVSIVMPPSACPGCGSQLKWFDNIPLVSWIILRGRCRTCKQKISIRYPVVELLVGALWAATVLKFGLVAELPAFLAFWTTLVILSAIDLEHKRIPNKILGPAVLLALALLLGAALWSGELSLLIRALLGGSGYFVPMLVIGLISPKGMGFGDIKFSAYLGLHLGWLGLGYVFVGAFTGFFLGALIGIVSIAAGHKSRKDSIPFGPSMALGTLIAVFTGERLLDLWLS